MGELHRVCKNFTRHDKKTRTILLCEMLEYTNVFLEAAFRAEGYSFETLKNPVKDRTLALRYISNFLDCQVGSRFGTWYNKTETIATCIFRRGT